MNSIKLKCYCFRQHTSKYPPHFWWVYKGWPMKLILHKQLVTFTVLFKKTFPNVMLCHIMLTQNMYRHHHDLFQPSSSHYSNSELFLELLKDSLPRSFFLFLCWSIIQNVNDCYISSITTLNIQTQFSRKYCQHNIHILKICPSPSWLNAQLTSSSSVSIQLKLKLHRFLRAL